MSPYSNVEKFIGNLFDKEHQLFTPNATTALWALLTSLGFKNKKIIVPVNVCFVVPAAILWSGNQPCFCDIDERFSINPESLKSIMDEEVAAVIIPHMYGEAARIVSIMEIAQKKNWIVIEDVAQSLGAKHEGKYLGTFAPHAITSFGKGKIIDGAFGGMLLTNSPEILTKSQKAINSLPSYHKNLEQDYLDFSNEYVELTDRSLRGENVLKLVHDLCQQYKAANLYRFDEIPEHFLELEKNILNLPEHLRTRTEKAQLYLQTLNHPKVKVVKHSEGSTYWRQNILVKNKRNELLAALRGNGIKASNYFPPLHLLFNQSGNFEKAINFHQQVINLWPGIHSTQEVIIKTNKIINDFFIS